MYNHLKHLFLFIFTFTFFSLNAQTKKLERPKLVVGLVVDQMRWDYLYKYYDRYGEDGFKRMLTEGFTAENTFIPYVPTYTAIGHSSVYTGSVPAIHGIAGNNFYIKKTQTRIYCTQDDSVSGVGLDPTNKAGKMSPKNLLTSTITDELKLATDFQSKVFGVSLKDRGAILPVGHYGNAAYWMVDGNWVSSSFYMDELPNYVKKFNREDRTTQYLNQGWNTLYDLETYNSYVSDDNPYEEPFIKGGKMTFPLNLKEISKEVGRDLIKTTPYGNTITFDFAKVLIENENLGNNPAGVPDFLAVSLSSPDYIGHQFALNSAKVEDNYLRLDKELGEFLKYLDAKIGKGNYTIFLSSDHGAAHNPQFVIDEGGNAGFFPRKELMDEINSILEKEYGFEKLIYNVYNNQVHLNHHLIDENQLDVEEIKSKAIRFYKKQEHVSFAVDMENLANSSLPNPLKSMAINGYNFHRSGDILLVYDPQWYDYYGSKAGTTHGSWNPYDSHIPLVFMGWGIKQGKTHQTTYMTDIASTLAALLHISQPNGNIGNPIVDLLN